MRVKLNANVHDDLSGEGYDMLVPHLANTEEMMCSEEIRLKFDALNLSKTIFQIQYSASWIFENDI